MWKTNVVVTREIAANLQEGDIIDEEYTVVWVPRGQDKRTNVCFDVKNSQGNVMIVNCIRSTTFEIERENG